MLELGMIGSSVLRSKQYASVLLQQRDRCTAACRPRIGFDNFWPSSQGFRKVDSDRWEFYEENFQQGRRDLLHQIHRRKPSAQPAGQVARTAIEVWLVFTPAALHLSLLSAATCCLSRR